MFPSVSVLCLENELHSKASRREIECESVPLVQQLANLWLPKFGLSNHLLKLITAA